MDILESFKAYRNEMNRYGLAASRIYWDMETSHTPKKAVSRHVDAFTFFNVKVFAMQTAPEYRKMLEELSKPENYDRLDEGWQYTVRHGIRKYDNFVKMPAEFYEKMIHDQAAAERVWVEAKRNNDFASFAPWLKTAIEDKKQQAAYLAPDKDPYDVLIDLCEEGMNCETIDPVFNELKEGLKILLPKILAKPEPDSSAFKKHYDIAHEKAACAYLLKYIGYDMEAGNMDEAEHPVTMGTGRTDVRVTDHYYEDKGIEPLFSIIHEGGHGIFEQSVSERLEGTDAEDIVHMGLHESQSRFFENILGRNRNFWAPIYGDLQRLMPEFSDITLDQFYREINRIHPSMIRTQADEVTYCMHVILRHEMEKEIFRGDIDVMKLPEMWNDKMEEYLGIRPRNDKEGILQDMHWSSGYLGYFPTYLLGSIYDGMFLEAMEADLGPVDNVLAAGDVLKCTNWLQTRIHQYGSLYTSPEVIKRVTGKPLSAAPLMKYFTDKYTKIYQLN